MPRSRSRSPKRTERWRSRSRERRCYRQRRSRSRSPAPRYRSRSPISRRRSRSHSPRRRSPSPMPRRRSPSPQGRRSKETDAGKAVPVKPVEKPVVNEEQLKGLSEEDKDMIAMMGFMGFDSTKGKRVEGNESYSANIVRKRRYRQYMNRRGGFNRPLDFIA